MVETAEIISFHIKLVNEACIKVRDEKLFAFCVIGNVAKARTAICCTTGLDVGKL